MRDHACVALNAVNSFLKRSMDMKTTAVILILIAIAVSQPAEILRLTVTALARLLGG